MRILSILLLTALLAPAQNRQERAKRVMDEALAALGGDHYLAMRDRVESGRAYSFYRERLSGLTRATIYTRYLVRPEPPPSGVFAIRERQAFGKGEDSATLFTDDKGWSITFRGARPLDEKLVARYKDSTLRNIFYIFRQRLGEPGLIFESQGIDVYENHPVEIVDITDADNRVLRVYFHQSTKLPIRQVFYRRDPITKDRDEEVTLFSKFRDVGGGVQWPFTIQRERNGEKIFEIYSDSVTINRDLADNMFTLPGDIKILKPAR